MSSKHSFNNQISLSFTVIHPSVQWTEAAVIWSKDPKIQFPAMTWTAIISSHSISHQPSLTHSLCQHAPLVSLLSLLSIQQVSFVCSTCLILSRSKKDLYEYDNMHVLHSLTLGAVHIHPWCHTRGLSVWRNSHTSVWVQSCFLWADPHRLADQLVTSEGWVPGKSELTLLFCDI